MTKPDRLQAALAKSLTRPSHKPVANATVAPAAVGIAQKLSVSLHPADLARIKAIQAELAKAGIFASTSEAIKIAIRGYEPTSKTVNEGFRSLLADDQRRK
jgi:hypothetical protein